MGKTAILALADGSVFKGTSIGSVGKSVGEVVFNTAMTGYQEILTDPSYAEQIITLTYPHIGNTGINSEDFESERIWAAGLVIRDLAKTVSNWRSELSLQTFLQQQNIVAIADIDTRKLTRILRDKGAQSGCILADDDCDPDRAIAMAREFAGLEGVDLAKVVSTTDVYEWCEGTWSWPNGFSVIDKDNLPFHVVVYDFGVKRSILRLLVNQGCRLTVVPADTPAETVLEMSPDGVFFSNGPGDPSACGYAIDNIQKIMAHDIPVFGICLGFQLLALACGAQTRKMKFGHHGANHPVLSMADSRVLISSQNHCFSVDTESLSDDIEVTSTSLFDGSLQGFRHKKHPAFGFQGHPEAGPGPHDLRFMFEQFTLMMRNARGTTEHAEAF